MQKRKYKKNYQDNTSLQGLNDKISEEKSLAREKIVCKWVFFDRNIPMLCATIIDKISRYTTNSWFLYSLFGDGSNEQITIALRKWL